MGFTYAGAYRTQPAYRWTIEELIYLSPGSRGCGVGKTLPNNPIDQCMQRGFRQMAAVIGGAQPASVRLHDALGFAHCGTIRGSGYKHGRWLDTAIMPLEPGDGRATVPDSSRADYAARVV